MVKLENSEEIEFWSATFRTLLALPMSEKLLVMNAQGANPTDDFDPVFAGICDSCVEQLRARMTEPEPEDFDDDAAEREFDGED